MTANAGLGLGLPSSFAYPVDVDARSCSTKTITPSQYSSRCYLFPLPQHGRVISAETVKVSYWSPNSDIDEYEDSEDEEEEDDYHTNRQEEAEEAEDMHNTDSENASQPSPDSAFLATPAYPQLATHACLHLLSPKLDALASAAAQQGRNAHEALCEALDYAWLVPMVGK